jgi:hypothetical protein
MKQFSDESHMRAGNVPVPGQATDQGNTDPRG